VAHLTEPDIALFHNAHVDLFNNAPRRVIYAGGRH
jgi:hypothetical protein